MTLRWLVAASSDGMIYVSIDAGQNWTSANAPSAQWQTIASSADGIKLVAGIYDTSSGGIYMAVAPPVLTMTLSGQSAVFSWPASAAGFTLQRNPDLAKSNWIDVGSGNLSNGVNQMTVSAASGRSGKMRWNRNLLW